MYNFFHFDEFFNNSIFYRNQIGAEHIKIFTDIKKKHCAHTVTSDVSIGETASAASFFLSDGLIVTGSSTGSQADPLDLEQVKKSADLPVFIGSGITPENLHEFKQADGVIVGSYLKANGLWSAEMDETRVQKMAKAVQK